MSTRINRILSLVLWESERASLSTGQTVLRLTMAGASDSQVRTLIAPELSRVRDLCAWPRGVCESIGLVEGSVLDRGNYPTPPSPSLHTKLTKYLKCVSFGPLTGPWVYYLWDEM